ncbi:aldo/keto reductase [Iamia sp. SCSIO 61187]|uniref:aldo/keto reductase n=1 Tax=Iamia sp. SCSIO 61187 TaxID=2722752 RepID=UPI001C63694D|nr:aldo/keto reductase [Iamia sp. SCSIO 61187]QYG91953.1 aldo/keto reductase [Iamia sp. SCSIO 61187]
MEQRRLVPRDPASPLVPVVGMGTSQTFDTDDQDLVDAVVARAMAHGTTLFDSSPMYGRSEATLGRALEGRRDQAVVATKVWTPDDGDAEAQMDASARFYGGRVDLMQVHNMVAWRTRLDQVEARRERGEVAFVGATHWQVSGFADLEECMATGRVDVVQVPYNPVERDVEERILPRAAEMGLGVLVMRPFANAALLRDPPPAPELAALAATGIATWSQALLAWGLSHPAVAAAIPATSKPDRAEENAAAGALPPLDPDVRARIASLVTR